MSDEELLYGLKKMVQPWTKLRDFIDEIEEGVTAWKLIFTGALFALYDAIEKDGRKEKMERIVCDENPNIAKKMGLKNG